MLLTYYSKIFVLALPWIVATFAFSWYFGTKHAVRIFNLDNAKAGGLVAKSVLIALICCLPVALLVPIWSGLHMLAYFVLAVGVQFAVASKTMPDLKKGLIWQWSWRSNGIAAACSLPVWIASMALYMTCPNVLKQLPMFQPYISPVYRRQQLEAQRARTALKKSWYKVPPWAAGKWQSKLELRGSEPEEKKS